MSQPLPDGCFLYTKKTKTLARLEKVACTNASIPCTLARDACQDHHVQGWLGPSPGPLHHFEGQLDRGRTSLDISTYTGGTAVLIRLYQL